MESECACFQLTSFQYSIRDVAPIYRTYLFSASIKKDFILPALTAFNSTTVATDLL